MMSRRSCAAPFLAGLLSTICLPAFAVDDPLPDGGIAQASGIRAYFAGPTDRYAHAVLGDAIEASSLVVEVGGKTLRYDLPEDSVFEDLTPRLVDADGDGTLEILAIKTYLQAGATIALYGIEDDGLVPLAEADPIGMRNRWLNPAGVADFDGDGVPEIAVIRTPHIGGILILYRWDGESTHIDEEQRHMGYSTHAIGARALGLAVTTDWNGDGVIDLVLPRQNRREIVALSMAGGAFQEIEDHDMGREIVGDLQLDGNVLTVPLRGGLNGTVTRPNSAVEEDARH